MDTASKNTAMHISVVTIIINLILSVFKAIAGIIANSASMVSDSVHSASDVISTVVVMIGIKAASKSSDKNHPYGHERIECIASVILSAALFVTGVMMVVLSAFTSRFSIISFTVFALILVYK